MIPAMRIGTICRCYEGVVPAWAYQLTSAASVLREAGCACIEYMCRREEGVLAKVGPEAGPRNTGLAIRGLLLPKSHHDQCRLYISRSGEGHHVYEDGWEGTLCSVRQYESLHRL
jgi:hypothetical protein